MAKALFGHVAADPRGTARLSSENARLRARVSDLEALVLRLQAENDRLVSEAMDAHAMDELQEMLPA